MKSVKRVLAMALMSTMAFGTMAFASDTTEITGTESLSNVQVEVEGTTTVPTISVTVPTSASFIINPFGIEAGDDSSQKQIISPDIDIVNNSDVKMDVILDGYSATVSSKDGSDKITLSSAAIASNSTSVKKDVFVYLGVKNEEGNVTFDAKANAKQVVKLAASGLNTKLGTMGIANEDDDSDKITLAFDGSVNKNAAWNEDDAISVVPTFKFVPQMAESATE